MNTGETTFTRTLNATNVNCDSLVSDLTMKTASVETETLKIETPESPAHAFFNVAALATVAVPGDTVPGVPGDLRFHVDTTTPAYGVYYCSAGTGASTGNTWKLIGEPNPP